MILIMSGWTHKHTFSPHWLWPSLVKVLPPGLAVLVLNKRPEGRRVRCNCKCFWMKTCRVVGVVVRKWKSSSNIIALIRIPRREDATLSLPEWWQRRLTHDYVVQNSPWRCMNIYEEKSREKPVWRSSSTVIIIITTLWSARRQEGPGFEP